MRKRDDVGGRILMSVFTIRVVTMSETKYFFEDEIEKDAEEGQERSLGMR